ncbi:MAG: ATP-binding protein [Clostridia bacterium]
MTRDQLITQLQQEYAQRREQNLLEYERRTQEACERCPGLRALLEARHAAILSGVRTSLLAKRKVPEATAGLPDAMAGFNQQIARALVDARLAADCLQPVYTCADCRDEGYLYAPSRRMCPCMARELNQRMLAELGLTNDPQTFERFDESLFSAEPSTGGVSQREVAKANRNVCLRYADAFPATDTRDLLLLGKSGLGKTYLLHAIAHRVVEGGVMPMYLSAYRFFEQARKAYFDNNSDLLAPVMNAPLLLLDDLGTEPLMQNITITQFFNLLNERQLAGRHTVISTNLTLSELRERYTERITSRFLDATSCARLSFIGTDVRRNLKREVKAP